MENIIIKVFDKLSKYDIVVNLIPGSILVYILYVEGFSILADSTIVNILICYYAGLINNRFSSLCVEGFFRLCRIVPWRDYSLYNKAKKERPFLTTLQENANQYRAMASVFFLAMVAWGYKKLALMISWLDDYSLILLILLLMLLFAFSYRKQVKDYVVKNIDEVAESNK